jgi:hypothetical protein
VIDDIDCFLTVREEGQKGEEGEEGKERKEEKKQGVGQR